MVHTNAIISKNRVFIFGIDLSSLLLPYAEYSIIICLVHFKINDHGEKKKTATKIQILINTA